MVCNSRKYFITLIFVLFMGCGYYSFTGALPSELKNVAVILFYDNTAYPNISEDLTNKVTDALLADNTLKITDESNADLIISGTILSIQQRAAQVSEGETVNEYNIYVNVKTKCEDIKNQRVLWEKTVSQFGIMPGDGGQDDKDLAITVALDKITEDILNNTLGYW